MKPKALLIDDEPDILSLLNLTVKRMKIDTDCASSVSEAVQLLSRNKYDFCLSDMRLPDGDGMDIVKFVQSNIPEMPIAIITAHGNMELGIEAMKNGAFDFVSKPVDLERLRNLVKSAIQLNKPLLNKQTLADKQLIGSSESMDDLRRTINQVSRSQAPVYISGESGTGKELVAQLIHSSGSRADSAFVPVNCSAIPKELMESEFFGHIKGSFTGAVSDKKGLFAAADGGTLFLDEIADLPLDMQVKLLRAIQEQTIRPVGSEKEQSVNVRILSATHKNLSNEVRDGNFRQDLFYRINVIEIRVPPLRERSQDVPELADFLMAKLQQGSRKISLSKQAIAKLLVYDFPGNVRELENVLERALTLCESDYLTAEDISINGLNTNINHDVNELTNQELTLKTITADSKQHMSEFPARGELSLDEYLMNIERELITAALNKCRWNRTKAAKELGISFRALRYKLEKLEIE